MSEMFEVSWIGIEYRPYRSVPDGPRIRHAMALSRVFGKAIEDHAPRNHTTDYAQVIAPGPETVGAAHDIIIDPPVSLETARAIAGTILAGQQNLLDGLPPEELAHVNVFLPNPRLGLELPSGLPVAGLVWLPKGTAAC